MRKSILKKGTALLCSAALAMGGVAVAPSVGVVPQAEAGTQSSPTAIQANGKLSGWVNVASEATEYYKFSVPASGQMTFKVFNYGSGGNVELYDSTWTSLKSENVSRGTSTSPVNDELAKVLEPGTYYLAIKDDSNWREDSMSLRYVFSFVNFKASDQAAVSLTQPQAYSVGKLVTGAITNVGENGPEDFYKFKLSKKMRLATSFTSCFGSGRFEIYDGNYTTKLFSSSASGSLSSPRLRTDEVTIGAGTYYIKIYSGWDDAGKYQFRLAPYVPTVDTPYVYSWNFVTPGKRKAKVQWSSVSDVNGYQVKYKKKGAKKAKYKKVSASKTSTTIKKLKKGKKYNFKVRAIVKCNGKNYYSKWSKGKTVKIK